MSEQGLHLVCRSLLCRPIQTENDNNNNNNNIVRTFKQKKESVAHSLLYSTEQYSTVRRSTNIPHTFKDSNKAGEIFDQNILAFNEKYFDY